MCSAIETAAAKYPEVATYLEHEKFRREECCDHDVDTAYVRQALTRLAEALAQYERDACDDCQYGHSDDKWCDSQNRYMDAFQWHGGCHDFAQRRTPEEGE